MGLLRRAARRASAMLEGAADGIGQHMSPMNYAPGRFAPVGNALMGASLGGLGGGAAAAATGNDPGVGMVAGMGLGAGAGLGRTALQFGGAALRGGLQEMADREPALLLEKLKQESMQWVRDPRLQARITAAETPDEIEQIVNYAVSTSRVRQGGG